jgi:hypothetical protein
MGVSRIGLRIDDSAGRGPSGLAPAATRPANWSSGRDDYFSNLKESFTLAR